MPVYPGAQTSPFHSLAPVFGEQTAQACETRNDAQMSLPTPGEELVRQFSRIAFVDSAFFEPQKRTSNPYCLVRTPCTAVPGAVLTALISLPRPMMTMLQVPSE
jgi:hypothetical protein